MYATRTRKVKTDRRDDRALAEACLLGATGPRTGSPMPSAMSGPASPSGGQALNATGWSPDHLELRAALERVLDAGASGSLR